MEVISLSKDTTVFNFKNIKDFETCVVLIERAQRFYLIDTYCGSKSMIPVVDRMAHAMEKDLVVINTHFHWDHIWGNGCFEDRMIIAHDLCPQLIEAHYDEQLKKNLKYTDGVVRKVLPNLTISERLHFHDDGIEIFYSPGHTKDCISVYDHKEDVLYVGDNLEKPLIYVEDSDVDRYIDTLSQYLDLKPARIVASHTLNITEDDVRNTIEYLQNLKAGVVMSFDNENAATLHEANLKTIGG